MPRKRRPEGRSAWTHEVISPGAPYRSFQSSSGAVPDPTIALTVQMLEWIASRPRTHAEIIDVWRTSCPRLSIWEDACINGLVEQPPGSNVIAISTKGRKLLQESGHTL